MLLKKKTCGKSKRFLRRKGQTFINGCSKCCQNGIMDRSKKYPNVVFIEINQH